MRRILKIGVCVALVCGVQRFCHKQTDGFAIEKISSSHTPKAKWEIPATYEEKQEVKALLAQEFYYLAKGAQSYVFESADHEYVLKFFRHSHMRPPFWVHLLPSIGSIENYRAAKIEKGYAKLYKDFASYQIAFKELKEETGLVYLHLNKTDDLKQKVKIWDKIGIGHILDLDSMEFIVQKKAELIFPAITKWMNTQEEQKAKDALSSLIAFLKLRRDKGIFDKDPDLNTNFGFYQGKAIQIDVGRFKFIPIEDSPKDEIVRITDNLLQFLNANYKGLSSHLQAEIEKI